MAQDILSNHLFFDIHISLIESMCTLCFGGKSCIFATDRYYKDDGGVGEPGFDEAKKLAAPFLTPGSPRGVGG